MSSLTSNTARRETYKVIPAVYLLLFDGPKIMLSKRANTGYEDGNYGLIAGHVEANETLRAAIEQVAAGNNYCEYGW